MVGLTLSGPDVPAWAPEGRKGRSQEARRVPLTSIIFTDLKGPEQRKWRHGSLLPSIELAFVRLHILCQPQVSLAGPSLSPESFPGSLSVWGRVLLFSKNLHSLADVLKIFLHPCSGHVFLQPCLKFKGLFQFVFKNFNFLLLIFDKIQIEFSNKKKEYRGGIKLYFPLSGQKIAIWLERQR